MSYDEFIALDPGLLRHPSEGISRRHRQAAPGADASAIQGRLSAQVALLQSPILPAAQPAYPQQTKPSNISVDDTHTCIRCEGMSIVNGAPWHTQDAVAERTEAVSP